MSPYNPAVGTTETVSFPLPLTAPAPAKKLRGLPLVALWGGLIAAPWVILYQAAKLVF
ncbi:hypothetical protein FBZ82_102446 [Azospirillum brasilense]|uniref:Uncharacterized protein n=1 Tax=Azospirillum brasilense TaxID=192 RepID=A0A560BJQ2_AZOBR|nr:hypothetical protein [Azospirillum brasilense]TWA72845.1 hypothetical protein FBZ82_102446 [Azospirillum brasilense]